MGKTTHYANQSNIKTNKDIISMFYRYNINIILIGSEAGKIYDLCDSNKDIDFLIDSSEYNLFKIFQFVQQYFNYTNFQEFLSLDSIIIRTKEIKYIELLKNPDLLPSYNNLINNANSHMFFDHPTLIINESDYIEYIKRGITKFTNNIVSPMNNYHLLKFKKVLQNFEHKYKNK